MNQLPLFATVHAEPARRAPDLAYVRKSLHRLLRLVRDAQILPWSEGETETREKLFLELAASLPEAETQSLTSEFRNELLRLRSTG